MIALFASAFAAPPPSISPREPSGFRVVARGLVEQWDDPALATVYKSGTWLGGVGVIAPVWGPILVDLEASFKRISGAGSTFEIAPLSGLVEVAMKQGSIQPYAGLGPTWTVFSEKGATTVNGSRIAGEIRGGLRINTGLVQPPLPPASGGPVKALEIELYLGRRMTLPGGTGLSLGAWRGSLGVGVAF